MAMEEKPSNHLSDQLETEQLNHEDPESKPPAKPKHDTKSLLHAVRSGVRQSSAISALLASAAAQLYGIFKSPDFYKEGASEGPKDTVLALCYTSLILNIGASIAGFVVADIGEIHAQAVTEPARLSRVWESAEWMPHSRSDMPIRQHVFGHGRAFVHLYWAFSFFGGIVSLLLMIFVYVLSQEKNALKIYVSILSFYVLSIPLLELYIGLPSFWRSLRGGFREDRTKTGSALKAQSANGGTPSFPADNRSEATLPQTSPKPDAQPITEASTSSAGSLPGGAWGTQDHHSAKAQSMV